MSDQKRVAAMQKDQQNPEHQPELSEVWRELLGQSVEPVPAKPADGNIPTLESDPWSELVQVEGTEVVDLHSIRLQMTDQDVEQALQVMQEQPDASPDRKRNQATDNR
jgi:hypothetical protein